MVNCSHTGQPGGGSGTGAGWTSDAWHPDARRAAGAGALGRWGSPGRPLDGTGKIQTGVAVRSASNATAAPERPRDGPVPAGGSPRGPGMLVWLHGCRPHLADRPIRRLAGVRVRLDRPLEHDAARDGGVSHWRPDVPLLRQAAEHGIGAAAWGGAGTARRAAASQGSPRRRRARATAPPPLTRANKPPLGPGAAVASAPSRYARPGSLVEGARAKRDARVLLAVALGLSGARRQ